MADVLLVPPGSITTEQARRLLAAGVTREHVRDHHDWRSRLAREQLSRPGTPAGGES